MLHHRPGSRRDQRQRAVSRLRQEGRYGPTIWEVLPGFVGLGLAVLLPLVGLVLLGRWAGWWAPLLLLAALGAGWLQLRRRRARPRLAPAAPEPAPAPAPRVAEPAPVPVAEVVSPPAPAPEPVVAPGLQLVAEPAALAPARPVQLPRWSVEDLVDATDGQYRAAVAALLDRDGWPVREIPVGEQIHLVGTSASGQQIGVACFRPDPEAPAVGSGSLRLVAAPAPEPGLPGGDVLYVMVTTGLFPRETVRWAPRHHIHLLNRPLLERWLDGEALAEVLDLEPAEAR
jgi:hypothetical protein